LWDTRELGTHQGHITCIKEYTPVLEMRKGLWII